MNKLLGIDTPDLPLPLQEQKDLVFTVSSLAKAIKKTLEGGFGSLKLKGEISGAKLHSSGHLYFALKDSEAVIDGVCWRPVVSRLGYTLEDGMEVICTGRLTTYPNRSKYQIIVDHVELAGEGALLKVLEERKKRLWAEGLFAPEKKRPLPFLPTTVGLVTSPTGAVLQDILHRIQDRFPCHVLLWPVLVQGEGAAAQISAAIEGFNRIPKEGGSLPRPQLLIVARGGGSLEDLWAFNEECVVRAAAQSEIPLISAVGHETDTTLIDYAADLRAPTPTAAAEKAVPVRQHLWTQVQDWGHRLPQTLEKMMMHSHVILQGLGRGIPNLKWLMEEKTQKLDEKEEALAQNVNRHLLLQEEKVKVQGRMLRHPSELIQRGEQLLHTLTPRLTQNLRSLFKEKYQKYQHYSHLLESFSPHQVLERGYTMIWDTQTGLPLTRLSQVQKLQKVRIRFYDGDSPGLIGEEVPLASEATSSSLSTPKPKKPEGLPPSSQGRLW